MAENPVTFDIEYPASLSRGMLLLKTFFGFIYVGIPHMFCLFFYGIAVCFVLIYVWFAILFTAKYPPGAFEFVKGYIRWMMRVNAYWTLFMTDVYPPFTGVKLSDHPVEFDVEYPERLSRGLLLLKTFLGQIYVGIPHMFCLLFYSLAMYFVSIYVWFYILFTGKYPQNVFEFMKGYYRWYLRVMAYWMLMMTDAYPPFSNK